MTRSLSQLFEVENHIMEVNYSEVHKTKSDSEGKKKKNICSRIGHHHFSFCVLWNKEIHIGLEEHEGD